MLFFMPVRFLDNAFIIIIMNSSLFTHALHMQVAWLGQDEKLTWEPSLSLPAELINEFHRGIAHDQFTTVKNCFGSTNHTLFTATSCDTPSKPKKLKPSTFDAGYVVASTHKCMYAHYNYSK